MNIKKIAKDIIAGMVQINKESVDKIMANFKNWVLTHKNLDVEATDEFLDMDYENNFYILFSPKLNNQEGGYGELKGIGVIKIFYDNYNYRALLEPIVLKELKTTLLHEITHAIDKKYKNKNNPNYNTDPHTMNEWIEYWNDPEEIRAYMRTIYEQIKDEVVERMNGKLNKVWGFNKILQVALRNNKQWKVMEKYLSDTNKRLILKGIVKEFTK